MVDATKDHRLGGVPSFAVFSAITARIVIVGPTGNPLQFFLWLGTIRLVDHPAYQVLIVCSARNPKR
ncbi:MAG: hypothetical protein QMB94_08695 [Phycisphaerales bacterium]